MIKSTKIQNFHSLASSYSKSFTPMIWFLLIKNFDGLSPSITHIWTLKLSPGSNKNKLQTQNVRERYEPAIEERERECWKKGRMVSWGSRGGGGGGGDGGRGFGWEWGRKTTCFEGHKWGRRWRWVKKSTERDINWEILISHGFLFYR